MRGGGASELDGIQEFKKSRCQAFFFNVILYLLQNLKFVKERSRNRCAMTEQFPVILNLFQDLIIQKLEGRQLKPTDVKKSGGQASLEGKKIGRYEGRLLSVNSQSFNPPTLLPSTNHSGGNAMLIPPYGLLTCDKPLSLTLSPKGREDKKEFPSLEALLRYYCQ